MTKFDVTRVVESVFLGVNHAPYPKGPPNYAYMVWPRAIKFNCNTWGGSSFQGANHALHPKGQGHGVLQIFGTLYTRNSNQILHGDQARREENFFRVNHAPTLAKIFDDDANADARYVYGS